MSAGRRQKALERPTPPEKGARKLPPWPPSGPVQAVGEPPPERARIGRGRTLARLRRDRASARARGPQGGPRSQCGPRPSSDHGQGARDDQIRYEAHRGFAAEVSGDPALRPGVEHDPARRPAPLSTSPTPWVIPPTPARPPQTAPKFLRDVNRSASRVVAIAVASVSGLPWCHPRANSLTGEGHWSPNGPCPIAAPAGPVDPLAVIDRVAFQMKCLTQPPTRPWRVQSVGSWEPVSVQPINDVAGSIGRRGPAPR